MSHPPALALQSNLSEHPLDAGLVQEHRERPVGSDVRRVLYLPPGLELRAANFAARRALRTPGVLNVVEAVVAEQDGAAWFQYSPTLSRDRRERAGIQRREEEHPRDRVARAIAYLFRERRVTGRQISDERVASPGIKLGRSPEVGDGGLGAVARVNEHVRVGAHHRERAVAHAAPQLEHHLMIRRVDVGRRERARVQRRRVRLRVVPYRLGHELGELATEVVSVLERANGLRARIGALAHVRAVEAFPRSRALAGAHAIRGGGRRRGRFIVGGGGARRRATRGGTDPNADSSRWMDRRGPHARR